MWIAQAPPTGPERFIVAVRKEESGKLKGMCGSGVVSQHMP